MRVYIAAGWFSPEQEKARLTILNVLENAGIDFYSPKDHGLYIPGKTDPALVFRVNIKEILKSTCIVASTEGKDMGTIFECGFAFANSIPVIYYWDNPLPLNLMLSESAIFVATSAEDLHRCLLILENDPTFIRKYSGRLE